MGIGMAAEFAITVFATITGRLIIKFLELTYAAVIGRLRRRNSDEG